MRPFALILALFAVFQRGYSLEWNESYPEALTEAKKEKKILLMSFMGSDWCPWCKKLDAEVFEDPRFAAEVGNDFVFMMVDFPKDKEQPEAIHLQNEQLLSTYKVIGYPMVILVHPEKGEIARLGYLPIGGKNYAEKLKKYIHY